MCFARPRRGKQVPPTKVDPSYMHFVPPRLKCSFNTKNEAIQMDDLIFCIKRARDGTRTRDPHLGKVVLHQLSHSRLFVYFSSFAKKNHEVEKMQNIFETNLSQLGYLFASTTIAILKDRQE